MKFCFWRMPQRLINSSTFLSQFHQPIKIAQRVYWWIIEFFMCFATSNSEAISSTAFCWFIQSKKCILLWESRCERKGLLSKEFKPISEHQNKQKNIITSPFLNALSLASSLFPTLINHRNGMFTLDVSLIDYSSFFFGLSYSKERIRDRGYVQIN